MKIRLFKKKKLNKAQECLNTSAKYYKWHLKQKRLYSNEEYIMKTFKGAFGKYPDLKNPRTYPEKLQWMKLYYNDPLYARCADKYLVREYVESKGLGHILNEMYGVYESPEEIDLSALPDKFVIKATHGCKWNFICRDKAAEAAIWKDNKLLFGQWLREDYSVVSRELHYTYIRPRLIAEKFIEDDKSVDLTDYKIFCFHGEPKLVQVVRDRVSGNTRNYYDPEWNPLPIRHADHDAAPEVEAKPDNLEEMMDVARKLSEDFTHVRVDLYNINGKIYFGELTMTSAGGWAKLEPEWVGQWMGDMWRLPLGSPYVIK